MYCSKCGEKNIEKAVFCKKCGNKISLEEATLNQTNLKPITGWLALVGLGLIVGILMQGFTILTYLPLLGTEYEIVGYSGIIQIEFIATIIIFVTLIYLLYLYFKRKKEFPLNYIYFQVFLILYVLFHYYLLDTLVVNIEAHQKIINDAITESSGDIGRTIIFAIIWSTYLMKSKQVKEAFVR